MLWPKSTSASQSFGGDVTIKGNTLVSHADDSVEMQFSEVESMLEDLYLDRTSRFAKLELEGEAKLRKREYERELARIERERQLQEEKLKQEEERRKHEAELKRAQEKAEAERRKRDEERRKLLEEQEAKERQKQAEKEKLAKEERERKAKTEREAQEAAGREKQKQEAAQKAAKAQEEAVRAPASTTKLFSSPNAGSGGATNWLAVTAEYEGYMNRIKWIKVNVKQAVSSHSKDMRNETMNIKLQLRPKFGMLTNSRSQLIQCRDAVREILAPLRGDQLKYNWILNTYAKMLVEQSESEANVKHQNALPLAMLTMLLWSEFPEIGDFVIPRFIKRCPQLIGYYTSIDTAEGRKKMGWKKDEDTGKYETEEQYMGRLSGICAVWACMTQSKLSSKVLTGNHPYPLSHSWKFLARMLNKPPNDVVNTDYSIVAAWWDMTAMRFHEAFGKQATKLLDVAWNVWTGDKMDPPAMRLRGLGENWKTTGKLEAAWKPLQP